MSEDSRKYGVENTCTSGSTLSKAALNFARTRAQMEKERGNLLKALGTQVIILLPRNMTLVLVFYITALLLPASFAYSACTPI